MREYHPLARELNETLEHHPALFSMLSERGKRIYFPKGGILGQSAQAKGMEINATIGISNEDDNSPMCLEPMEELVLLPPEQVFPYAPSAGIPELRQSWAQEIRRKNPSLKAEFSSPVVTTGLTHALSMAGYLFANPGDDVIVTDPCWDNYSLSFEEAYGAELKAFPLFDGNQFNIEGLRSCLFAREGKRIVLLNFPNNPTGYTPLKDEAEQIGKVIKEAAESGRSVVALLDDAYFGLQYGNAIRESLFVSLADLHQRVLAVKIDGSSKEEFNWGGRIGFLTYGAKGMTSDMGSALAEKTAGAVRGNISSSNHAAQWLLYRALNDPRRPAEKEGFAFILRSRFTVLKAALAHPAYVEYFRVLPCNSGYFLCLEMRDGIDAEKVRQLLRKEYRTGLIAQGSLIRIAFSSVPEDKLPTLVFNLADACRRVRVGSPSIPLTVA